MKVGELLEIMETLVAQNNVVNYVLIFMLFNQYQDVRHSLTMQFFNHIFLGFW
jgi:hypothetical protein